MHEMLAVAEAAERHTQAANSKHYRSQWESKTIVFINM